MNKINSSSYIRSHDLVKYNMTHYLLSKKEFITPNFLFIYLILRLIAKFKYFKDVLMGIPVWTKE